MSLRNPNPVNATRPKRVALVISSPAVSTTTGWPVGFWWSELTHPYLAFTEKGYEVEVFSPRGGRCEADALSDPRDPSGSSETDLVSAGFLATPRLAALVESTRPVSDLAVADFDAIVVAGGQAPMFTFEQETDLHRKFVEFYESGKVAAALCHGTAILRYARLSDGTPLAKGKTVTGFANVEEDFADNAVWDMRLLPRDRHFRLAGSPARPRRARRPDGPRSVRRALSPQDRAPPCRGGLPQGSSGPRLVPAPRRW